MPTIAFAPQLEVSGPSIASDAVGMIIALSLSLSLSGHITL